MYATVEKWSKQLRSKPSVGTIELSRPPKWDCVFPMLVLSGLCHIFLVEIEICITMAAVASLIQIRR